MVTWKQFKYRVEQALEGASLDPANDKIHLRVVDVLGNNVREPFRDIAVTVDTSTMPAYASVVVEA